MKPKERIMQFIEINHHLMTMQEMAGELGVSVPWVTGLCKEMNLTPISESERTKEFIQNNPHLSIEDIAEQRNRTTANIRHMASELGIKLKTRQGGKQAKVMDGWQPTKDELELIGSWALNNLTPDERKQFKENYKDVL